MTSQSDSPTMQTLVHQRKSLGYTQAHVAARMGTGQASISHYEAGRKQPTLPVLERWFDVLGLRVTVNGGPRQAADHSSRDAQ